MLMCCVADTELQPLLTMSQAQCQRCSCSHPRVEKPGDQYGTEVHCLLCMHPMSQHDLQSHPNQFNPDSSFSTDQPTQQFGLQVARLPTPDWARKCEEVLPQWCPREATV